RTPRQPVLSDPVRRHGAAGRAAELPGRRPAALRRGAGILDTGMHPASYTCRAGGGLADETAGGNRSRSVIMNDSLNNLLVIVLALLGVSIVVGVLGLLALTRRIRRLRIPPDADFFSTLRAVPLSLVVLLDLLDFGLDIFSAPIIWVVLSRMGLPNLRNKATIEALIPITNVLPTFT